MDFWSPSHFASVTNGRWLSPAPSDVKLTGVSIDTRTLKPGEVFFAIRGEQHDGHDHVGKAIELGAAMVVVEKEISSGGTDKDVRGLVSGDGSRTPDTDKLRGLRLSVPPEAASPVLLVPDTVRALQQLAAAWRDELRRHDVKVVAVTGSNGKTTTRNLIHAALSSTLRGTQSPKSFNNHLGVPLTLLAAGCDHDFVVAEVGTNHPGEIAALAAILRPSVAVITNIGTAHIGMFGSKDAIAAEKSSLYRFIEPGGVAVINGTQPYVERWRQSVVPGGVRAVTFGRQPECDVRTTGGISADERGLRFTFDSGVQVHLPLLGQHNVDNTLAAIAVSRALGVEDAAAARSLAAMTGVEMRMQVVRLGEAASGLSAGITLINDAYNANPDSMLSGLSTLASFPTTGRKVAILGDMLELGDESAYEHQHIGDMLCVFNQLAPLPPGDPLPAAQRAANVPTKIQLAILIGPHMRQAAAQLARVWPEGAFHHFDKWTDDLPARIANMIEPGDTVLLKASRGLRLERIVPALEKKFASLNAPQLNFVS